ncbi:unnamed protein product [Rangifer tarandus platyrhynchus]|uniref:Uncharacterized protein n=2 Tax=Rangifer tarandus platyrhynchus TaxID=3082113 RepID=A0ACB0FFE1_RANTA|nr:unnamed protein product [Rangifer tarandus platyrhynchus]CAI9711800.1 unnamed protein product [Rangifer tarandus platyrhynchus]
MVPRRVRRSCHPRRGVGCPARPAATAKARAERSVSARRRCGARRSGRETRNPGQLARRRLNQEDFILTWSLSSGWLLELSHYHLITVSRKEKGEEGLQLDQLFTSKLLVPHSHSTESTCRVQAAFMPPWPSQTTVEKLSDMLVFYQIRL